MTVADAARKTGDHFTSIRVGRLVGRGEAAIEALRSQLESEGLVTVNASEPNCYLMSIAEASELVLEAAALAEPGHVYRLDQGTPLRVGDVARDLIRLLGADPDLVPIKIVGRPPSDEPGHRDAVIPTTVPKLLGSAAVTTPPVTLQVDVERFLELARAGRSDQLRADLARYVRFIDSTDTPYLDEHGLRPMVPVPVTTSASEPSRGLFDGRRSGEGGTLARKGGHPARLGRPRCKRDLERGGRARQVTRKPAEVATRAGRRRGSPRVTATPHHRPRGARDCCRPWEAVRTRL